MDAATPPGQVVLLNGAPRSGKSSLAAAIQDTFDGIWLNLGVDASVRHITPPRYRPGIGLRPGGERPDLEPLVGILYAGLFESVAAHSRLGLNVVVDVGLHDAYARPLGILGDVARRLAGLPVLLVGVRCPVEVIMERRRSTDPSRAGAYAVADPGQPVPAPVERWQAEVHRGIRYDLEVDTSTLDPAAGAAVIRRRLESGPPGSALWQAA